MAAFLDKATEIGRHPLGGIRPRFAAIATTDATTGDLTLRLDVDALPVSKWVSLATWMRPIVFNEKDAISVNRLTVDIGREHIPLRAAMKAVRTHFAAWKKNPYFYAGTGALPDSLEDQASDYVWADLYFNAEVWHADQDKILRYRKASDLERAVYRKAAETRVFAAAQDVVGPLAALILEARAAGHDL